MAKTKIYKCTKCKIRLITNPVLWCDDCENKANKIKNNPGETVIGRVTNFPEVDYRSLYGHLVAKKNIKNNSGGNAFEKGKEYEIKLVGLCDQAVQVFVEITWNCITDYVLWGDDCDKFFDSFDWYDPKGILIDEDDF